MPSPAHTSSPAFNMASKAIAAGVLAAFFGALPAYVRPYWPAIMDLFGNSPSNLLIWGVFSLHWIVLIACNLFYLFLYLAKIPFFEQFKISPKKWNWEVPEKWPATKKLIQMAVGLTLFNNICIGLPAMIFHVDLAEKLGYNCDEGAFPSSMKLFLSIIFFMVCEDLTFYVAHRTLHTFKPLYAHVHKLHHRYYQSISIAAEFAHPLEFFLGNCLPFAVGPTLLGAHGFTWLAWTIFRIAETVEGHCGYEFPWAPWGLFPMAGGAAEHDAHHSINTGNYASFFTYWDKLFNTNISEETLEKVVYSKKQALANNDANKKPTAAVDEVTKAAATDAGKSSSKAVAAAS